MERRRRRVSVGSLFAAVAFLALAAGVIVFVPAHALDRSHAIEQLTPGAVHLPPTAAHPTGTPPSAQATKSEPTATPAH